MHNGRIKSVGQLAEVCEELRTQGKRIAHCHGAFDLLHPGHIRHLDYGFVTLAEYSPDGRPAGVSDRARGVCADLARAGVQVETADDLVLTRWQKLVWNVPFNGLSVVLDARIDEIMADPASCALAEAIMVEVAAGAAAQGRTIDEAFLRNRLALTRKMEPYLTSMKLDYDRGREMEVEAIFGAPLRAARAGGVECPRIAMLYDQLRFLDARNRAEA